MEPQGGVLRVGALGVNVGEECWSLTTHEGVRGEGVYDENDVWG